MKYTCLNENMQLLLTLPISLPKKEPDSFANTQIQQTGLAVPRNKDRPQARTERQKKSTKTKRNRKNFPKS